MFALAGIYFAINSSQRFNYYIFKMLISINIIKLCNLIYDIMHSGFSLELRFKADK